MKKILYTVFSALLLMLSGCSDAHKKPIVISTNAWIGFSPLFYAREMGWLNEADIKLISVVSLGESMHLYDAGSSDVFTGTQHEFDKQREQHPDLVPIILFDRSNGGDAVMSNRTIDQLSSSEEKIDVYMELDSINEDLLKYFIKRNHLPKERLVYHNRIQDEIQLMKNAPDSSPIMIVTYDPYNMILKKNGFTEIASTKDESDLFVVDAMYVSAKIYYENKGKFQQLDRIIDRSIKALHDDPRGYYEKVKPYLDNPTYEEFIHMLGNIELIHKNPSPEILRQMENIQFPSKDLIQ